MVYRFREWQIFKPPSAVVPTEVLAGEVGNVYDVGGVPTQFWALPSYLIDEDTRIVAVYEFVAEYYLDIITPIGQGTTNPATGQYGPYASGDQVGVSASAASFWNFSHWLLDGVNVGSINPITVDMDTNHELQAVFTEVPIPEHVLTINTTTGGTTSPTPGAYNYPENTTATVTAVPGISYDFDYWILDGATRTENPIDVLMDTDHSLTAYFRTIPPEYTLMIEPTAGGVTDPPTGDHPYPEGTTVIVTAIADSGYQFNYWTLDGVQDTANPINVLMDKNHTLQAFFSEIPVEYGDLTINVTGVEPGVNVTVDVNSYTDTRVGSGPVVFAGVYAQDYACSVHALGYTTRTFNVTVIANQNNPYTANMAPPGGLCLIATAAYGTPLAPQLNVLRSFRDHCLPNVIVSFYYATSPPIANYIQNHSNLRCTVRMLVEPIIKAIKKLR